MALVTARDVGIDAPKETIEYIKRHEHELLG
jgi:hypothetical protein